MISRLEPKRSMDPRILSVSCRRRTLAGRRATRSPCELETGARGAPDDRRSHPRPGGHQSSAATGLLSGADALDCRTPVKSGRKSASKSCDAHRRWPPSFLRWAGFPAARPDPLRPPTGMSAPRSAGLQSARRPEANPRPEKSAFHGSLQIAALPGPARLELKLQEGFLKRADADDT